MFLDDAPPVPETGNLFPGLPRLRGPCPICDSKGINPICWHCEQRKAAFNMAPLSDEERAEVAQLSRQCAEREAVQKQAARARFEHLANLGRPARIAFVGCGKLKAPGRAPARAFYRGASVRLSLAYAEHVVGADETYILSALHGLVSLDQELEPYDVTLVGKRLKELEQWRHQLRGPLQVRFGGLQVEAHFLAGELYGFAGLPGWTWHFPLGGLTQGRRLQFLAAELRRVGIRG